MNDIVTQERLRRAEKALTEELPAVNPLWKPWAMDLADDVNALVAERDEARREFVQIPTTAQILRAEEAEAERDNANVEWHRIRDLHAAAITDLREQVEEGARLLQEQRDLLTEVDCRIEHGAESGGHLEYVRTRLRGCLYPCGEAEGRDR